MRKSFEKFLERQDALARQYGKEYEDKQHNRGKLTARERITFLFDEGTFEEVDAYSPSAATSSQPWELSWVLRAKPHITLTRSEE